MPSLPTPLLSFIFGLFFVSIVSSKLVHLYVRVFTVPFIAFVFYLPTFFLLDLISICLGRLLLQPAKSFFVFLASIIGGLLAYVPSENDFSRQYPEARSPSANGEGGEGKC